SRFGSPSFARTPARAACDAMLVSLALAPALGTSVAVVSAPTARSSLGRFHHKRAPPATSTAATAAFAGNPSESAPIVVRPDAAGAAAAVAAAAGPAGASAGAGAPA